MLVHDVESNKVQLQLQFKSSDRLAEGAQDNLLSYKYILQTNEPYLDPVKSIMEAARPCVATRMGRPLSLALTWEASDWRTSTLPCSRKWCA